MKDILSWIAFMHLKAKKSVTPFAEYRFYRYCFDRKRKTHV